jgi:hypothetical protein
MPAMDLNHYRCLIMRLLSEIAELINRQASPGVEALCAFDQERDQYLLLKTGWKGDQRVHGTTLCLRIRKGRIWIEEDWTEYGIAADLLRAGVPKEDIVLAFQHPEMRPLTEFAVA